MILDDNGSFFVFATPQVPRSGYSMTSQKTHLLRSRKAEGESVMSEFCGYCGYAIQTTAQFCERCQKPVGRPVEVRYEETNDENDHSDLPTSQVL